MLKELTIKDFAIIEDLTINFGDGMSAILGETGAGKSIIIEAFSLLLGNRANSEMIRQDKEKAFVQAVISFDNVPEELKEYEDNGNEFIFTRVINTNGNNNCKINGITVPLNTLKSTLGKKVNLHSQHDLFYLLDSKYHLSLLDKFAGEDLSLLLSQYSVAYEKYLAKVNDYNKIINENNNIDIDYIKYQLEEIERINVKEGEDEKIQEELTRISRLDKIASSVSQINESFDKQEGICDLLYSVRRNFKYLSEDPLFSEYETKLVDLYELANEVNDGIKETFNSLDFDASRVEELKERSFEINKLKHKYGSYQKIVEARDDFKNKIDYFNDKEYYTSKLEKEITTLKDNCYALAKKISTLRKNKANDISNSIVKELKDLYLDKTIFKVNFEETELSSNGIDSVEFYISTNEGELPKPLEMVASGGEASRITLALNVVFNDIYDIDLAIFDEVDSGVSGKVARSMGIKIRELSKKYQTITISHLPQVLSCANNFYYIGKEVVNGKTRSYVKTLHDDEIVMEIGKILSGSDNPSEKFLYNAKELLAI